MYFGGIAAKSHGDISNVLILEITGEITSVTQV